MFVGTEIEYHGFCLYMEDYYMYNKDTVEIEIDISTIYDLVKVFSMLSYTKIDKDINYKLIYAPQSPIGSASVAPAN